MKKVLVIIICTIMAITTVGCTGKKESSENKVNKNETQIVIDNDSNSNKTIYFGKVKNIVGNEVELELAENQENPSDKDESESVEMSDEIGEGLSRTDVGGDMTGKKEGEEEGEGEAGGGKTDIPESNAPKLELKYTGESKNLIIPTGSIIVDIRSGGESKISAIKKGTVVRIYASELDGTSIVSGVEIVE